MIELLKIMFDAGWAVMRFAFGAIGAITFVLMFGYLGSAELSVGDMETAAAVGSAIGCGLSSVICCGICTLMKKQ